MNKKEKQEITDLLNRRISLLQMYQKLNVDGHGITLTLQHMALFIKDIASTLGIEDAMDYDLIDDIYGFTRAYIVKLDVDEWWEGSEYASFYSTEGTEVERPHSLAILKESCELTSIPGVVEVCREVYGRWVDEEPTSVPGNVSILNIGPNIFVYSDSKLTITDGIKWN